MKDLKTSRYSDDSVKITSEESNRNKQPKRRGLGLFGKIIFTILIQIPFTPLTLLIGVYLGKVSAVLFVTTFACFFFFWFLRDKSVTKADELYDEQLTIAHNVQRPYTKRLKGVFAGLCVLNVLLWAVTKNFWVLFMLDIAACLLYLVFVSIIMPKIKEKDLERVAHTMGFEYFSTGDISTLHPRLISVGLTKPVMSSVFVGEIDGLSCRIFDYHYKWMKKAVVTTTVLEVTVSGSCPNMLILSKVDGFKGTIVPEKIFPGVTIDLEGNFSDFFMVFVERGAEIEVREILAPDVMATFIDVIPDLNFLFFDNKVYVVLYDSSELGFVSHYFLEQFNKAKLVLEKLAPVLSRMNS